MREPGPFDRLRHAAPRDRNARLILVGMGAVGLLLLILVLPPISLLSGSDNGASNIPTTGGSGSAANTRLPKVPEGFEALSRVFSLDKPSGTSGPYAITLNLAQPVSDGRNIGFYTNKNGVWERVAPANLANNGAAASGQVGDIPSNLAVLRRTTSAAMISGWVPAGVAADQAALAFLTTVNPVDYFPNPDGTIAGTASQLPSTKGNVIPTIRAAAQREIDAVNTILASPGLRDTHIAALVQIAQQPGNAGIDVDYRQVNLARKADLTAFVTVLAERLHQAGKSLSLVLPSPVKAGVNWDTGAYDWDEIGRRADTIKLAAEQDPSIYYSRMEEVLNFLRPHVDFKKVALVVGRASWEKGTDGLRPISLREGLTIASTLEVRTTSQITPNASVVIVGKNIFQDDGASGLHWDEGANAVSFSYPGRGGQRTVWLENGLSLAFRIDLARRFGMAGVAVDNVAADSFADVWEPLRSYVETGNVTLVQPNGTLLRPTWQVQAGSSEANPKGSLVWRAPAQPNAYDVALVISDGVMRVAQKIVLQVGGPAASGTPAPGGTPARTGTSTPGPSTAPTVRP
jgi:spore germination protein YaaH